ncbi:MAG: hypothetical protein KGJ98_00700 [Chloroflexota bacterium]|nr:hypothetical protein [Chloroflexota bacterium]
MSALVRSFEEALRRASATELGRRALAGHDEDYQFDVSGEPTFHVSIEGGALAFEDGPSPQREPLSLTRLELSAATLRGIVAGEISPVQAMERGEMFLRTRLYGGGQMTVLMRAAYELARQQRLESGRA